jgi:hypothetical protein
MSFWNDEVKDSNMRGLEMAKEIYHSYKCQFHILAPTALCVPQDRPRTIAISAGKVSVS